MNGSGLIAGVATIRVSARLWGFGGLTDGSEILIPPYLLAGMWYSCSYHTILAECRQLFVEYSVLNFSHSCVEVSSNLTVDPPVSCPSVSVYRVRSTYC